MTIETIELILEPKLRGGAAERLIEEFSNSPSDSSLFAAVSYKLRKLVKAKITENHPERDSSLFAAVSYKLRKLVKAKITENHPDIAAKIDVATESEVIERYTEADPRINEEIEKYATDLSELILTVEPLKASIDTFFADKVVSFFAQIAAKIDVATESEVIERYTEAEIYRVPGINEEIEKYATYLSKLIPAVEPLITSIDTFFAHKVVSFFAQDGNKQLINYEKRLKNSGSWGTEEALCALNQFITGEEKRRLDNGEIGTFYARPINLKIFENGQPATTSGVNERTDIIIDNVGDHWISQIPPKKDLEILLIDEPTNVNIETILTTNDEIEKLISAYLDKPLPPFISNNFQRKRHETTLRNNLALATITLKDRLLSDILATIQEGGELDLEMNYSYQQLVKCMEVFQFITDARNDQAAKTLALENYGVQAKSNSSGWQAIGEAIAKFLLIAISVVGGAIAGAALGSSAGPGGTIAGAGVGAAFGLGSTPGILHMLRQNNAVQEYSAQATEAVKSSLEYSAEKHDDVADSALKKTSDDGDKKPAVDTTVGPDRNCSLTPNSSG